MLAMVTLFTVSKIRNKAYLFDTAEFEFEYYYKSFIQYYFLIAEHSYFPSGVNKLFKLLF